MSVTSTQTGDADETRTVYEAFADAEVENQPKPILGIFVHHGDHYTAMIKRGETIYHIDSLQRPSGEGRYVYEVDPRFFVEYAQRYTRGRRSRRGREIGGMYSVYYDGRDYLNA